MGIYFRSLPCALASFISGVFIDLDHFLDYYANHGLTFKLKNIYDACERSDLKKIYVVLHSYEIVILSWLIIYTVPLSVFWKAGAIGLTQHMIFDQLTNPFSIRGYFFTYRLLNGFDKNILMPEVKERWRY